MSNVTEKNFAPLNANRGLSDVIVRPSVSYWKDVFRRIKSDKVAMVSLSVIIIISLFAIFAPIFSKYGYETTSMLETNRCNVIVCGHMASDSIGMNIILDEWERVGGIETTRIGGIV